MAPPLRSGVVHWEARATATPAASGGDAGEPARGAPRRLGATAAAGSGPPGLQQTALAAIPPVGGRAVANDVRTRLIAPLRPRPGFGAIVDDAGQCCRT